MVGHEQGAGVVSAVLGPLWVWLFVIAPMLFVLGLLLWGIHELPDEIPLDEEERRWARQPRRHITRADIMQAPLHVLAQTATSAWCIASSSARMWGDGR